MGYHSFIRHHKNVLLWLEFSFFNEKLYILETKWGYFYSSYLLVIKVSSFYQLRGF